MPHPLRSGICNQCGVAFKSRQINPKFCTHEHYMIWFKNGRHPMLGKFHSEETKLKIREASLNQKNKNFSYFKSPEGRSRARQHCLKKRGIKNPKTSAYQLENPSKIRDWSIRSPLGVIYNIRNLAKFVRENINLFNDENHKRVYKGISKLFVCSIYTIPTQYKGWTANSIHLNKI